MLSLALPTSQTVSLGVGDTTVIVTTTGVSVNTVYHSWAYPVTLRCHLLLLVILPSTPLLDIGLQITDFP